MQIIVSNTVIYLFKLVDLFPKLSKKQAILPYGVYCYLHSTDCP